jgi:primary-amine oxidase
MDCPTYAHYLPATWHADEISKTHPMAICLFESDMGYLIQRHSSSEYVSATKNIGFVVRTVATVGNCESAALREDATLTNRASPADDYSFDYTFYRDGALETTVRASGYIQSAYYAKNSDYGRRTRWNSRDEESDILP